MKSFWDELNFFRQNYQIFQFKRSKKDGGAAITAPGDTNPSDATD